MNEREREIRRRRYRRKMILKRRRRRRRILLTIAGILLLLFILGVSACFRRCGNDEKQPEDIQTQEAGDAKEEKLDTQKNPGPEVLSLGGADVYRGDLILVNNLYEYRFEQNSQEIHLTNLKDYKEGAIRVGKDELKLAERILDPLYLMISDCNKALGVDNTGVTSAYRTREYQENVYRQYVEEGGVEYAEAYVSDPGYSEHHTGLSLDMGIYYHDGSEGSFSDSSNAVWMDEHCQEYGFIRRYKEEKKHITGISNEAWHFRYVGIPHAVYMNENDMCLEEYITFLRNGTSAEAPLMITCSTGTYAVYATKERNLVEPDGEYSVSGDNIDGFLFTVKTGEAQANPS